MPPCVGAQRPPDSSSDMTSPPETAFTEDAALDEDEFDPQSLPALAGWVSVSSWVNLITATLCSSRVSCAGQALPPSRNWKRITPVSVGLSFLVSGVMLRPGAM
jgi:hypothetical protein